MVCLIPDPSFPPAPPCLSEGYFDPVLRLLFVLFNSLYSFYWDVAKDWDLTLFSPSHVRNNLEHPYGLRRHTHFHSKEMYYSAIVIDLLLRCTWSLKLSPHLDHWNDLEGSIFVMEVLEVGRRWMWIFLRVETEWGKSNIFRLLTSSRNRFLGKGDHSVFHG